MVSYSANVKAVSSETSVAHAAEIQCFLPTLLSQPLPRFYPKADQELQMLISVCALIPIAPTLNT